MYSQRAILISLSFFILLFNSCKKSPTASQNVSSANTAPIASFTVDPTSGTTSTTFTFDASGSTDNEDATTAVEVRWDWENDGTYDTDFSTAKTATHQYASIGTYTVKLEVKDSGELTHSITKSVTVDQPNTAPTASFTVNPTSGTTSTVFAFDASGSTDNDDETSVLQVRWDWENDGTYDTNYSTAKTATHQYASIGTYTVKLEVKDSGGLTNNTIDAVSVYTVVTFSDVNFEVLIRETLNRPTGDITIIDLEKITQLEGDNRNISDISGIQYCTSLQYLSLNFNQINDISVLSNLTNLQFLHLWYNPINDISSLSGLTNLQLLYLGGNQIDDISSLFGMTNLQQLDLWENQINDISVLRSLTNLIHLDLSWNHLNDISVLSELTNLKRLYLKDNQVIDIYPLVQNSGINSGDKVNLEINPLSETSINTYIPQLEARGVNVTY